MASSSSSAPVLAGTKRPLTLDDQDEDVRIAVRALDDMRSRAVAHAHAPSAEAFAAASKAHSRASSASQPTPLLTNSSTSVSTSESSPVSPHTSLIPELRSDDARLASELDLANDDFVSRVSHFPLVNTALKAYDYTKERSRVVKYGANLMESSVKTISRPVIDRLPVGQLDDFACRQLDRLGYPKAASSDEVLTDNAPALAYRDPLPPLSGSTSRAPSLAPSSTDENYSPRLPQRQMSEAREESKDQDDKQVVSRSKWQAVLLEAGGIGAAVSEESMKRLQYCLQWLQYATAHIDSQMVVIRNFIDSISPQPPHQHDPQALVPLQTMRSLSDVRRDVVSTIRQVVDVISRYAGGALPEPARATVRSFILRLPTRWANATSDGSSAQTAPQTPPANPNHYRMGTEPSSPMPPHMRPTAGRGTHPTAGAATQAAQRILTLATESLDMMRSVTAVFKESLDRAEAWVERLRVMGIQRQGALPPPPLTSPGAGPSTSTSEASSSRGLEYASSPPSPTMSLSSSVHSFTSLSLATHATTSPATSIASGTQRYPRSGIANGDADAEGETETEDEEVRRRNIEKSKQKGKGKMHGMGMDVDG